jgi:alkylation response protein AidB-like acyl-CoA dehydrogenase
VRRLHQADRIIGAEGTCFKTVLRTLDFTRPTIGASDVAMQATTDAVQLFGGAGYTLDFPVERMMRDAKITQMSERTNQIQRMVIARSLLR